MRPTRKPSKSSSKPARRPALRIDNLEAREVPASIALAGGVLTYTAGAGVDNVASVSVSGGNFTFADTAETITTGGAGTGDGTNSVTFPTAGVTGVILNLGDGADTIAAAGVVVPTYALAVNNTGSSLTVSGPVATTTGALSLSGANAVTVGANVTATTGAITITANTDGAGAEGFSQTAGLISTTNTTATAARITVNTAGGGTGNASVDNTTVGTDGTGTGGKLTINSHGGSILYAGATALNDFQRGVQGNGGTAPARLLRAGTYTFTATGAGSIGTDARPIQSDNFNSAATGAFSAGSGGVYWTDWSVAANSAVFALASASAAGAGNVRVVTANASGHNLTVSGPVTTGSGSIYLAGDDNFVLTGAIGGAGFSGTVYLAGNRDTGNTVNLQMNAGASITTSNATANAVLLEGFNTNGTFAGGIILNNITTGNGGTVTATTTSLLNSQGDITMFNAAAVVNTGPAGTVILRAAPQTAAASVSSIGRAATPVKLTAGTVIASSTAATATAAPGNVGGIHITDSIAASYTASIGGAGANSGPISLTTTGGLLTVGGPVTAKGGGAVTLTGVGGVAINAQLGDAVTGNLTVNAGANAATLNTTLTLQAAQTLAVTAANGLEISAAGLLTGTGAAANATPVKVLSGGTIAPNGAAVGTINLGNTTLAAGGKLALDVASASSFDAVKVAGAVDVTGAVLSLNVTGSPAVNDSYIIIDNDGTGDAVTGQFVGGTTINALNNPRYEYTINYAGGDGNDVVATLTNIVPTTLLDVNSAGVANLASADGLDNNLTVSLDGGNYTITDSAGVIALSAAASAAGWTGGGTNSVTGPAAGLTGLTLTTTNGADTLNAVDAGALPLIVAGSGTLTVAGVVATTGTLTVSGVTDLTGTGTLKAPTLTVTASNAIGSAGQPLATEATTIVAAGGAGGAFLTELDGAAVTVTAAGDVAVRNTAGTLTVAGPSGSAAGNAALSSGDGIVLAANFGSTATGTVTIAANTDGAGAEGITQTAGTVGTLNTTASAVAVTVNTAAGGTGDAVLDSFSVGAAAGGKLTINSNGGSILYAGATALTPSQQGLISGGAAPSRLLAAHDFDLTATGAGSLGTDARPLQVSAFGTDVTTPANAPNTSFFNLHGGDGGVFLGKWSGTDMNLAGASATGAGDIRVFTPNVAGNNLYVTGNVSAVAGDIYLAADDDVGITGTAVIGGGGFSGTVWIQGNRDRGTAGQPLRMDAGTSIVTSNTTNAVVPLTTSRTPATQAVYLDISGDVVTPSPITLGTITAGDGGRIVVNATPNAYLATVTEGEGGTIAMAAAANVLDAGPTGTIELIGRITATTVADVIGTAALPIKVAGGNVVTNANFGHTYVTGAAATNFAATTVANTGWSVNAGAPLITGQNAAPVTQLSTAAGALTVNGVTSTVNGGAVTLTGAGGVVLGAQLGGATTGAVGVNGALSGAGDIVLGSGGLTVTQDADSTYDGVISGGQAVTKAGAGTLALSAANLYTAGTTVSAGGLAAANTAGSATGPGAVAVNDGATLLGTGAVAGAVTDSGTVSPAGANAGVLATGALTFGGAGGRTLAINLNGTTAGTDYDQLSVTGAVDLTGGALAVTAGSGFNPPVGTTFTIILNDTAADAVSPFAGLPQGAVITAGARSYGISYVGGDGNDVTLTAISGPPVNAVPAAQTVGEDADLVFSAANGNAISVANDPEQTGPLNVTLTAANGTVTLAATAGLTFTVGDGTAAATMTFNGTAAAINAALDGLRFTPAADFAGAATVTIATDDMGGGTPITQTDTDVIAVTVVAANDAPVNALPATFSAAEDTPVVLAGISVADVDAGSGTIQVTFSVPTGSLTVKTDVANGVAAGDVTGNGTGSVVLTGTLAAINATLADAAGLTFAPAANANGPVTLTMLTSDLGNTGGPALTDTDTAAITVTAVDDAPAIADAAFGYNVAMTNGTEIGTVPAVEVDGDALTYAITAGNTGSAFAIDNTGKITVADQGALTGTFTLTVTVTDTTVAALSDTATVTVTVNEAPTVTGGGLPDVTKAEDDPAFDVDLAPIFNDAETADANLVFTVTANTPAGLVTTGVSGTTLTVTPLANQTGTVSITVRATDDVGQFVEDTFDVILTAVNDGPTTAVPGPQSVAEDATLTLTGAAAISVTDIDAGAGTVTVTLTATNGTVSVAGPASVSNNASAVVTVSGTVADVNATLDGLVFSPTPDFNGPASLQVATDDGGNTGTGGALTDTDTVAITVTAVNDAPVATDGTLTTNEDTDGSGTLTVMDVDANPLTYSVVADPAHGSVTITNAATGAYTYTPDADYNGPDTFTFKATDGTVDSNVATVIVTVAAVNDAPVATDGSLTTAEDTDGSGTLAATDTEGTAVTFSVVAQPAHGTVTITDAATGAYTYTPDANYNGPDSFTFKASDGGLDSNTATVSITVTAVNDAPVATDGALTTAEDTDGSGTLAATDVDGNPLTFSIVTQPAHGTVTITNAATGAYTYTPAANYNGPDSFTFKASDGGLDSNVATVTVDVTAVNDAPVATGGALTTAEDTAGTGTLAATDTEGSALTYSVAGLPAHGTVVITDAATGAYTYTPDLNYNGPDSFTFTANDGTADSAAATVTITVTAVNDAPVATAGTLTTNEDTASNGTLSATDTEASTLTFSVVADPAHGSVTITNATTGAYTYTPDANYNGPDSFTFNASDGGLDSNVATVTVDVTAVNDAPVATGGALTTAEDTAGTGTLAATDTELSALTYSVVADPAHGSVTITDAATGAYTYTPAANYNGPDSFTFKASDGGLDSNTATVSITVTAVNDAPVAAAGALTTPEDAAGSGTVSATDTEGDTLTFTVVTQPAHGAVALNEATGAYTYTPAQDYNGPDSFTFKANDGAADSNTATVSITVGAGNDRPVIDTDPGVVIEIVPAKATAIFGAPVSVLTANVTDVDAGAAKGVAITEALSSAATGQWQFSINGGVTWVNVGTPSPTQALLLADVPANRVRFVPVATFTGFVSLKYVAWDAATGQSGAPGNTAVGTAFSTATEKATVAVGKTVPAIDFYGNPQFTSVLKDSKIHLGDMVKNLVGLNAVSDADAKTVVGIAVTAADAANGTWQYQVAGKWVAVTGVSESSALLLGPTTKVRFLPTAGFVGKATLTYRAWDQSVGKPGERSVITGSAFSAAAESAEVNVVVKPTLSLAARQTLTAPRAVASLLAGAVTDAAAAPVGIAVTGLTGKGVWSYKIGALPAVAITKPVPAPTPGNALLLPAEAVLSFVPAAGFAGATLSYKAWNADTLYGRPGDRANTAGLAFSAATETLTVAGAPVSGNTAPVVGVTTVSLGAVSDDPKKNVGVLVGKIVAAAKMTDANKNKVGIALTAADATHGTWQYSLDKGKTWEAVGSVTPTAALVLPSTASLKFVPAANYGGPTTIEFKAWDGTLGTAGDVLDTTAGTAFSAGAAAIGTFSVTPGLDATGVRFLPDIAAGGTSADVRAADLAGGPVAGALGIAVTKVSTTADQGTWLFKATDAGTFGPLPKLPAVLPATATLHFVAGAGFTGVASLTYKAANATGGLSTAVETLTVAVGNAAPTLSGAGTVTTLAQNPTKNLGDTVDKLLGATFTDAAVGTKGVAVTGVAGAGVGVWEYSKDAGKTWAPITGVGDATALLLSDKNKVRFVPAANAFTTAGAEPTITYRAWDQTVGAAGETADATAAGLNSFSAPQTAKVTVTGALTLNTALTPMLTGQGATGSVESLIAGAVTSPTASAFGIAVTGVTGNGKWQVDLGAGFVDLGPVSATKARLLPATAVLRYQANGNLGPATLTYKAWDAASAATNNTTAAANKAFFSAATETLAVNIGNRPPTLTTL